MARLLADEDSHAPWWNTAHEAGIANRGDPDAALLEHAHRDHRAVLTHNRFDFVRLHRRGAAHDGILVCRQVGLDVETLASQIHDALAGNPDLRRTLVRVYLNEPPRFERD